VIRSCIVALNGYVTTVLKFKPEANARKFNELHKNKQITSPMLHARKVIRTEGNS